MALQPLPHSTRQQVFSALMTFLKNNVPGPIDPTSNKVIPFVTYSQLWQQWDQVNEANQPAIFLRRGPQLFEQKTAFGVMKLHFKCSVWVYWRASGYKIDPYYPDQLTDSFIDGFEQAFQTNPPVITRQTLGNVVYHCWIDGQVYSDPGIADDQAVIVIPLSILL